MHLPFSDKRLKTNIMADKVPESSDVFPVAARGEQQITVQDINVAIPSKKGKVFSGKNIRAPRPGGFSTVFRDKKARRHPVNG